MTPSGTKALRDLAAQLARRIARRDDPEDAFRFLRRSLPTILGDGRLEVLALEPEAREVRLALSVVGRESAREGGAEGEVWFVLPAESLEVLTPSRGRMVRFADEPGFPRASLRNAGFEQAYLAPLRYRDERLGAVLLALPGEKQPGPALRRFAEMLAADLGAVLGRDRLWDALKEANRRLHEKAARLRAIDEIAGALGSSLILEEVFQRVAVETRRLLDFDRAALSVLDRDGQRVTLYALEFAEGGEPVLHGPEHLPVAGTISGHLLGRGTASLVADLSGVRQRIPMEEQLFRRGILAYVALPLLARKRQIGTFNLGSRRAGAFQEEQMGLLRRIGQHLSVAVENARLFRDADRRWRAMEALYKIGTTQLQTLDPEELTQRVIDIVHEEFRFDNCAVLLPTPDGKELFIQAQRGYDERRLNDFRVRIGESGITGTAAQTGEHQYVPDVRKDPRYIRGIETGRSELAIPLSSGGEFLGVLDIESPEVDAFSRRDIHVLKLFANQVAMALDKARLFQRLEEQARTDGLTGLLNQRTFHDRLGREVARTRRTSRPFSLVLLDMDNLKELNDECGHPAGNLALCRVADMVRGHSRSIDSAARYGGDEFALILAETGLDGAVGVAERLRQAVAGIHIEGFGTVSASCGVAAFPTCARDEAELVYLADRAMYEAKRGGRNRVAAASVKGEERQDTGTPRG